MQSIWCLVYVHSVQMQWRQEHTASFHDFFLENIPNSQKCLTKISNDIFFKQLKYEKFKAKFYTIDQFWKLQGRRMK